ncbi:MAG: hypothetical protein JWQ74_322 [Marmoricola sp.]|nr:hypothetical protein [Marmoricola sp.]
MTTRSSSHPAFVVPGLAAAYRDRVVTTCSPRAVGALAVALALTTGCSSGTPGSGSADGPAASGTVVLAAVCPLVHTSYDALVSSAPPSQQAFVAALERMWHEADAAARESLSPLLGAARSLADAGRGDRYAEARDGVYAEVVGLSRRCADVGRPILHPGH